MPKLPKIHGCPQFNLMLTVFHSFSLYNNMYKVNKLPQLNELLLCSKLSLRMTLPKLLPASTGFTTHCLAKTLSMRECASWNHIAVIWQCLHGPVWSWTPTQGISNMHSSSLLILCRSSRFDILSSPWYCSLILSEQNYQITNYFYTNKHNF